MKRILLTFMLISMASIAFSQNGYKKTYRYDVFKEGWAMVKTISNTYGFIDREGNTVVQPIYAKIEKFEHMGGQLAMVKNISGAFGFIDTTGAEVISAVYWSKREAMEAMNNLKEW